MSWRGSADAVGQHWRLPTDRPVAPDRAYAWMRRLATAIEPGANRSLPWELDALVGCAVEASGAVAGALYLCDADRSLSLAASHGLGSEPAARAVPAAAYTAVMARGPTVSQSSPGARATCVCVPLLSATGVLGVLCCSRPAGSRPGQLELTYLSLVAAHASSAVQSARAREAAAAEAGRSERRRLARELHDSVSQSLYSIGLGARTARELLDRDPALARQPINQVLRLAETGIVQLRALVFDPAPDWLAEKGLVAALEEEIAAAGTRSGVATHTVLGPEPPVPIDVKQALYRIAREALRNIARHARAGHLTVRLEETANGLTLEITDDGVGFDDTASFPGHLGVTSMHEWIADVGGVLDITSTPGRGTRIRARAPVPPAHPDAPP